ncbi:LOW QUALITY PROTEIN: copper amine oxidase [Jimgerdemannia flammicorona]|uniref:Amine oxidase n=1 Tax=Jimgerdemannia flammicorona TaxID=994334 RepID=A0A433QNR3_9FUNG|nr:LOW QUALITY PROTEIN: copper amine oxidase [Jimgerdemannia flammicorona]
MTLHPLDPLSGDAKPSQDFIFNSITHREPRFCTPHRTTRVVRGPDRTWGDVYEAVVDLQAQVLKSWLHVPGVQPTLTPEDCFEAERTALADEAVKQECAQLGIVDVSLVVADPWFRILWHLSPPHENWRLVQLFMFVRNNPTDNHYAHPLDFVAIADLIGGHVTEIERLLASEGFGVREIRPRVPKTEHNYDPDLLGSAFLRKDLKPLQVLSPEGPSFKVDGNAVEWQKFKFSFNYCEGLVLHNLTYKDGDKVRPLLIQGSLLFHMEIHARHSMERRRLMWAIVASDSVVSN